MLSPSHLRNLKKFLAAKVYHNQRRLSISNLRLSISNLRLSINNRSLSINNGTTSSKEVSRSTTKTINAPSPTSKAKRVMTTKAASLGHQVPHSTVLKAKHNHSVSFLT